MQRIKTTIIVLSATLALTSCSKTYQCHCELIPGATPEAWYIVDYKVKAPNSTKAIQKCNAYDNEHFDCSIIQ